MKLLTLLIAAATLHAADVRVLCSNGMRTVVEAAGPDWEKATRNKLVIEYSSAGSLKEKIAAGAAFDATILTVEVAKDLAAQSKFAGVPKVLAKGAVGVGIHKGATKPSLKTPEEIKAFLLKAKSVTYTENGASRPAIDAMFEKLGIAAQMKPKIQLVPPGIASENVGQGKAEVVLTLVSEIMGVAGVELVGALPAQYQGYVTFSGAVGAKAAQAKAAGQFLDYLGSSKVDGLVKEKGLER